MNDEERYRFSFHEGGGGGVATNKYLLRGTSMLSSRRAMTHGGVSDMDGHFAVDVGAGKTATLVEELIARLEPHGVRRLLLEESGDQGEYENYVKNNKAKNSSLLLAPSDSESTRLRSSNSIERIEEDEEDSRNPYFYFCICCDCRLSAVSDTSSSMEMLQDIHYHSGMASHRKRLSWLVEPEQISRLSVEMEAGESPLLEEENNVLDDVDRYVKETLRNQPEWQHTEQYLRVFVNDMPVLLSRRPGGGDMFFPLPHEIEEQRWGERDAQQSLHQNSFPPRGSAIHLLQGDSEKKEFIRNSTTPLDHYSETEEDEHHWNIHEAEKECGPLKPLCPPSVPQKSFWYYPMQSLSCHSHQHLFLAEDPREQRKNNQRIESFISCVPPETISVEDIPWEEYVQFSPIEKIIAESENGNCKAITTLEDDGSPQGSRPPPMQEVREACCSPSRVIVCLGRKKRRKRPRMEEEVISHTKTVVHSTALSVEDFTAMEPTDASFSPFPPSSGPLVTHTVPESSFLLSEDVVEYPDLKKNTHATCNRDISRYAVVDGDAFDLVYMNRVDYRKFFSQKSEADHVVSNDGVNASSQPSALTVSILRQLYPLTKKEAKRKREDPLNSMKSFTSDSDDTYLRGNVSSSSSHEGSVPIPEAKEHYRQQSVRSLPSSSLSSSSFMSSVEIGVKKI